MASFSLRYSNLCSKISIQRSFTRRRVRLRAAVASACRVFPHFCTSTRRCVTSRCSSTNYSNLLIRLQIFSRKRNHMFLSNKQRSWWFRSWNKKKSHDNASLKGQSSEIFSLQFLSSFGPTWALDQWVKIFSNLGKFSRVVQIFRGILLCWVSLSAVWYPTILQYSLPYHPLELPTLPSSTTPYPIIL